MTAIAPPQWLDRVLMHRRAEIDRERCGPKIIDSSLFGLGIIYKAISLVRRGRHPKTFTSAVVKLSPKLHQNDWPMVALINFVATKARFIIGASGAIIDLVRILGFPEHLGTRMFWPRRAHQRPTAMKLIASLALGGHLVAVRALCYQAHQTQPQKSD
jgi:hypothetical protein